MYINIFNIPLYYISFNKDLRLETHLKKQGFKNITHFKAIDGRKLKPINLLKDNVITIRSYNDLVYGRNSHTGHPSLGSIGCFLSHIQLWKHCINNNFPYMIIVEDDAYFSKKISSQDISFINNILSKPNGLFISPLTKYKLNAEYFFGTHFYIIRNDSAKELYKKSIPIDVQVDSYVANIANRKSIDIGSKKIVKQKRKSYNSSIQNKLNSIKINLPKNNWFYIGVFIFIIVLIIMYIFTVIKLLKDNYVLKNYKK